MAADDDTRKSYKTCILVLCGIPAAGKTTIATAFRDYCRTKAHNVDVKLITVDELMEAAEATASTSENWNAVAWHESRNLALQQIEGYLQDQTTAHNRIIILDDNMYYKSMRKTIFRMATVHKVGYCCVYLDVTLEVASQRNQARDGFRKVPDEVIRRMFRKMESPTKDDVADTWDSATSLRIDNNAYLDDVHDDDYQQYMLLMMESINELVLRSWDKPVHDACSTVVVHQREEARIKTKESRMHRQDLILRRVISEIMTVASQVQGKGSGSKTLLLATLSHRLQQIKSRLLREGKSPPVDDYDVLDPSWAELTRNRILGMLCSDHTLEGDISPIIERLRLGTKDTI